MITNRIFLARLLQSIVIGIIGFSSSISWAADETFAIDEINATLTRQIHKEAIIAYGNTEKAREYFLKKYLATLPKEYDEEAGETFYFVEGDIRLSKAGVKRYLEDLAGGGRASDKPGELLVLEIDNEFIYWKERSERRLTYKLEHESFRTPEEAELTSNHLLLAAEDWIAACPECGITFERPPPQDTQHAKFVLRFNNDTSPDRPVVWTSFPHVAPGDRQIVLYPKYFELSDKSQLGVMRHELGHFLGYRHEHNRHDTPRCGREQDYWKPLTPYDATSIMHYFCNGSGPPQRELSQRDIEGHRCLYLTGSPCPQN